MCLDPISRRRFLKLSAATAAAIVSGTTSLERATTQTATTITFFAETSAPADNGAQGGDQITAITPPGNMQEGDLVLVSVQYRATALENDLSNRPRISEHGGQAWSWNRDSNATDMELLVYWCR